MAGKKYNVQQFEKVYELGKLVHNGSDKNHAIDVLVNSHSFNKRTANYFITAVISSLSSFENSSYTTSTNVDFTRFFLDQIKKEYPIDKFNNALNCNHRHAENWIKINKTQKVKMITFLAMLDEFRPISNTEDHYERYRDLTQSELEILSRTFPKKPTRVLTTTWAFIRNSAVVLKVLNRAAGYCEMCKNPAPFLKINEGGPYLEVHHIIPLADDGDDIVENAMALCPNCHREAHLGVDWKKFRKSTT